MTREIQEMRSDIGGKETESDGERESEGEGEGGRDGHMLFVKRKGENRGKF